MLTKLLQKIDLWIISSAANILSLALPIYVIQALSRYLASGIDATLYALTAGVIVSIGAEFLLRQYRRQAVLLILRDESNNSSFFDGLRQINFAHPALANWSNLPSRIQRIRKNRTNRNIDIVLALYDIPFAVLFIAFIYLISPVAFVIFIIICLMGICFSAIFTASEYRIRSNMIPKQYHMDYAEAELLSTAYAQASLAIQRQWLARYQKNDTELNNEQLRLASNQHNQRLVNMVLSNILIALTIFSSVILVFKGELEIGALIALNILVAKSFIQLMQFPAIFKLFRIAKNNKELSIISNLASKVSGKSSIKEFSGNVELRQVIFQQSARMGQVASNPISYYFSAGTTTVITGANGVGKTSLYELLCGSHIPQSGVILIDGVDRQQLSFDWWSTQVGCLSQDPQFLNETLYNSFNTNGVDEDTMSLAIFHAGLKPLVDNLPSGIHTSFADNKFSSLKIRKQVALAHILSRPSQLILMDEPTAGLDSQTAMIFYNQMNQMIAQKRTLIIFSTDPVVMKGADTVISIGTSQGMLVTKNRRQPEKQNVALKPDEKNLSRQRRKLKRRNIEMIMLRISAYLIFLLIIGVIWASYFSKIDIVTHASGKVVPFGKTRTIQNLEGGIVKEIKVLQGDRVAAGDIVIELEELASKSEVEELETRIVFLNTEIITLNGLISGKKVSYPDEYQRSYKNIVVASEENAQSQVKLLDSQISLQERMIENLNQSITIISEKMAEKKEMAKLLDKQIQISSDLLKEKLTSELEHLDLLRSRQGVKAELSELKRNIQSIDSEIQDAKSQIIVLKSEFNSNISSQIQKYTEEEQKYASRLQRFEDELGRRVVKSPVDGIIKQLFVSTIGGVVAPGMDIAEIVPSDESLVIEAELPVSDIGFVTVGQEALIRLAGSHSRYFQPMRGEVAVISPDTVKTEDGNTAYIVRLVTEEVQFSSREAKFNLYPGLVLDCSIVIGERSILLNIIAPLIDMKHSAMRENVWSNAELDSWQQHFSNIFLPSRWKVEAPEEN